MTTSANTTETVDVETVDRAAPLTREVAVPDEIQKVIAVDGRPPRPSGFATSMTFGWRALLRIKHVPEQLFDVTVFPVMMTLMFTYLFGGAIAGSTGEYLQFVLPGILVMSVVTITMYTGVALNTDIERGVFDRFRSLPLWRPSVLVGALLGDLVRYTLAGTVILVLGLILGFRPDGGLVGVVLGVALLLLFAFSLSWVWVLFGLILRTPQSVMSTAMMIIFPLTFVSNVFVDPATMPGWLQGFVDVNPVSLVVTAIRGTMDGTASVADVGWVLVSCALLVGVFGPLTMHRFRTKS